MSTTLNPQNALQQLDAQLLGQLLDTDPSDAPFLSIYMPTARRGSDTRENPIRFKRLLQQAEAEANTQFTGLHSLVIDEINGDPESEFWQNQLDGLALFHGKGETKLVRIARPITAKVAVANSYHVKPLMRILQTAGRYQLLAITQKSVRLYEGDMDSLDEIALHADVPRNIVQALGGEVSGETNVNAHSGAAHGGMHFGHHDNKDDRDVDLDRYFRVIDKAVYDYHGRGGDLPLYFAGDVDYHDRFFKASHHPRLIKQGLRVNPDAVEVDSERLRIAMAKLIRPAFDEELFDLSEQFGTAKAQKKGSDDLAAVAEAAFQGRVMTLLVDADKSVGGRIDPETGTLRKAKENDALVDDVLDDIAELVMKTGGRVRVVPSDKHPTTTGIAAIYRY